MRRVTPVGLPHFREGLHEDLDAHRLSGSTGPQRHHAMPYPLGFEQLQMSRKIYIAGLFCLAVISGS